MELQIIRYIQSFSTPFLDALFMIITMLGEDIFIVVLVSYVYWCYDKEYGQYLGYTVFTSLGINNLIKDVFKMPRPIGQEGIISKATKKATGYSFPSGHTQMSATILSSLCIIFNRKRIYIFSAIGIILVGVSRLYLGVHYPKDVLVGVILGIIIPIISSVIYDRVKNIRLMSIVTLIPLVGYSFFAESDDYFKALGLFVGFTIGMFLEYAFVNFKVPKKRKHKIIRMILGVFILAIIKISLGLILPNTVVFMVIEYCAVSIGAVAIAPKVFKIFRI